MITYSTNILADAPFNNCILFNVSPCIFYLSGVFVKTDSETVVVDKYSNIPSYKVGFEVSEGIVTSDDDEQLLDNAQDTPNYAAPTDHTL